MPPQRHPLGAISGNRLPNYELSPYERGKIIGGHILGFSPTAIAIGLNQPRGTVFSTIQADTLRCEGETKVRAGRPKEYTERDERALVRHVRLFPKHTYAEVIKELNFTIKKSTIKKILKKHHITNWRAKRRPELTEAHAARRLAWCLENRHRNVEEWGMFMWSDECSVERGRGKANEWVFRTPDQKWERRMVQTYTAGKGMRAMVWGCFWDLGRSNLYIMDRDFESKKHGYSANSYLEVLNNEFLPHYQNNDPGYIFMQDNARIHTAYTVRDWFIYNNVTVTPWPPYSPDLNPIEHIWWELKKRVVEMFPEVATCKGESEDDRQRLESCLQAAWDTIDKEVFDKLYQSMPSRIEACIAADGWHTKY